METGERRVRVRVSVRQVVLAPIFAGVGLNTLAPKLCKARRKSIPCCLCISLDHFLVATHFASTRWTVSSLPTDIWKLLFLHTIFVHHRHNFDVCQRQFSTEENTKNMAAPLQWSERAWSNSFRSALACPIAVFALLRSVCRVDLSLL